MRIIGVCTAALVAGAVLQAPASAAIAANTSGAASASGRFATAWTPPEGYVYEAAWLASEAYCEAQGEKGISEGRWTAYVCNREYRGGADIPLLFWVLYVKK